MIYVVEGITLIHPQAEESAEIALEPAHAGGVIPVLPLRHTLLSRFLGT